MVSRSRGGTAREGRGAEGAGKAELCSCSELSDPFGAESGMGFRKVNAHRLPFEIPCHFPEAQPAFSLVGHCPSGGCRRFCRGRCLLFEIQCHFRRYLFQFGQSDGRCGQRSQCRIPRQHPNAESYALVESEPHPPLAGRLRAARFGWGAPRVSEGDCAIVLICADA